MDKMTRNAMLGTAACVGAKYLDAKLDLAHDINLIAGNISVKLKFVHVSVTNLSRGKRWAAKDRLNFFYQLEDAAKARPNASLLVYQGKEWTYAEVVTIVKKFSNYFLSQGIKSRGPSNPP
jgi:hypothetical protein